MREREGKRNKDKRERERFLRNNLGVANFLCALVEAIIAFREGRFLRRNISHWISEKKGVGWKFILRVSNSLIFRKIEIRQLCNTGF